jgi:hypothetical protein
VVAATLVGRVEEGDALGGGGVGRIADAIARALQLDRQHCRARVDLADQLAFGEHARGAVDQLDRDGREPHGDLALEQRDPARDRHRFARRR